MNLFHSHACDVPKHVANSNRPSGIQLCRYAFERWICNKAMMIGVGFLGICWLLWHY